MRLLKAIRLFHLRYLQGGLAWICQSATATESEPEMKQSNGFQQPHSISLLPHGNTTSASDLGISDQGYRMRWWYERVNQLTEREFTFKKDRLPAIEGLATVLSDRKSGTYEGGIWHEDFRRGLLWVSSTSKENLNLWPSWSWAAADRQSDESPPYNLYDLGRHGHHFLAEILSLRDAENNGSGRKPSLQLTLQGWAQSIGKFLGDRQFYHPSESRNKRGFCFDPPKKPVYL